MYNDNKKFVQEEYYSYGKKHRLDGPAVDKGKDNINSYTNEYWIDGKRYYKSSPISKQRENEDYDINVEKYKKNNPN